MKTRIKPIKNVITIQVSDLLTITASNKASFNFLKITFDDCEDVQATYDKDHYLAVIRTLNGITNDDVIKHMLNEADCDYWRAECGDLEFKGLPKHLDKWKIPVVVKVGKSIIEFIAGLENTGWLVIVGVICSIVSVTPWLPTPIQDFIFTAGYLVSCSIAIYFGFALLIILLACVSD